MIIIDKYFHYKNKIDASILPLYSAGKNVITSNVVPKQYLLPIVLCMTRRRNILCHLYNMNISFNGKGYLIHFFKE
jgi:hypothetical protein